MAQNTRTDKRAKALEAEGFYIGPRDPNRNKAFQGEWMVAEDLDVGPTDDASTGGFCIVGDDLDALVNDAYDLINDA